jgi:hypothetical protein
MDQASLEVIKVGTSMKEENIYIARLKPAKGPRRLKNTSTMFFKDGRRQPCPAHAPIFRFRGDSAFGTRDRAFQQSAENKRDFTVRRSHGDRPGRESRIIEQ